MPGGACPARDPKNQNREHRRAMRARAARVRESRGSVLRLRGGDPDIRAEFPSSSMASRE